MKKALPVLLLLAAAVAVYLYVIQKRPSGSVRAPDLVPDETIALLFCPDVPRTQEAWKQTALFKISQEPEVVKFLAPYRETIPGFSETRSKLEKIAECNPTEAFVAITDDKPSILAGFQFTDGRENVEALLAEAKAALQDAYPTGKSDIQLHGTVQIETFRTETSEFAAALLENWFLAANDFTLLKRTLDRLRRGDAEGSLGKNALFKEAMERIPEKSDAVFFAQTGTVIERIITLLSVSGQKLKEDQVAELRKVKAFAASAKFEGENVRDTFFALKPGSDAKPELTQSSLAFTAPDTIAYYASRFEVPEKLELPDATLDVTGVIAMAKGFQIALESQGVTISAIGEAFGPETGALLTWGKDSMQPTFLMVLDVRDYEKAVSLLDSVARAGLGGIPIARKELEGGVYYAMQSTGLPWLPPPGMVLSKKYAVIGFSIEAIMEGLTQAASGEGGVSQSRSFSTAVKSVDKPTRSFAYVDAQKLFDRVYGAARAFLITYAMFAAESSSMVDPTTLPPGEVISKHLGPMVFSQSEVQDGVLAESVGPVTFSQAIVASVVVGGAAALPLIKQQLEEGGLLPGPGAGGYSGTSVFPGPTGQPEATPAPVDQPGKASEEVLPHASATPEVDSEKPVETERAEPDSAD